MAELNIDGDSSQAFDEMEYWGRIKLGDKTGLEGLYTLFARDLMAYGLSIVPNRSLVKDCIQELFIEIWRYRNNNREVKNVKMYVFRSLAYKINKEIRKEKKRHQEEQSEAYHSLYLRNDQEVDSTCFFNEENTNKRLVDAMEKLPLRQREVIQYVFFENLPNDQISHLMGINIASVYTLTWKAICNLRKYYLPLFAMYLSC